jgi:site-specific DNA-cytosine methylase
MGLIVLSLFDGISCGQHTLQRLGIQVDAYYASEVEPHAIRLTKHNFPDTIHLGDVQKVRYADGVLQSECGTFNVPRIDLLIGGSPCQGFSQIGQQLNFEDSRSKLIMDYFRLLEEVKPRFFLLENVRMKAEHSAYITWKLAPYGATLHQIDAKKWSAQLRKRLYWTNIKFDLPPDDKTATMQNLIGDGYEGTFSKGHGYFAGGLRPHAKKMNCLTACGNWHYKHYVVQHGERRSFVVEEAEQLMGVSVGFTHGDGTISKCWRFRMLGNGWSVPVISVIFSGLKDIGTPIRVYPETPNNHSQNVPT